MMVMVLWFLVSNSEESRECDTLFSMSAKRHKENSNIIKEIRASTDAAIRNQGASVKTLEIQIGQMSKVLQERGIEALFGSTEPNPRDHEKSIPTAKADSSEIYCMGCSPYAREAQDVKILEAYDHTLPQKEKDPGSFTLPCFIHNVCFDKALVDLGAIRIGKFIFPIYFIILDILEDDDVPLILGRPFLSTAHSKIDVYKRNFTLRAGEEKLVFKSIKPATSLIRRVFMLKDLDLKTKLIGEDNESFDPLYGNYIELNDLDTPLESETNQDVNFETTFVNESDNVKTSSEYCNKMNFSCTIGYKNVNADFIPSLSVNLINKIFYYSIIKDKGDHEGKSSAGTLIDILVFIGKFSIITGFIIIDDVDITIGIMLGMPFFMKYVSCQMKFVHGDKCERMMDE
ncbi:ribonuclease H-like domain-containing protein [Tanacetum coccineum]